MTAEDSTVVETPVNFETTASRRINQLLMDLLCVLINGHNVQGKMRRRAFPFIVRDEFP
ncbi:hypothetical protein CQG66_004577 [Salmonella enterica subsp. enterica]|nr:hypothetical protein [Salmonella enterica subsp. enterica]EEE2143873.1 hypothetical protein [Salmonella enterica subsp. enterica serovar 4,[5],12:i:-]CDF54962.1 hypothetical protein BN855_27830 [Salmonella enterica subsp. enterica serovar Bovismorbificans str. 3114]EDQ3747433.1 hypothetical protein [Salmonella enterica subsp. enterica]EDR4976760.1 hypothetical protein [Salmonella enterica subsp. enterica]